MVCYVMNIDTLASGCGCSSANRSTCQVSHKTRTFDERSYAHFDSPIGSLID